MIAGVLKRRVTAVTKGWNDPVDDGSLRRVVEEVLARMTVMTLSEVTGAYPEKS